MIHDLLKKYIWLVQLFTRAGDRGLTFEEVKDRWEERWDEDDYPRRTFVRHRDAIENLFGIRIVCDRSTNRYSIPRSDEISDTDETSAWLINAFTLNSLLSMSKERLSGRVSLEDIPSGQRWLTTIMDAMENNSTLSLEYRKYRSDEDETLTVRPYAVKEADRRWYLVGWCEERRGMRVYALDRIHGLTATGRTFRMSKSFDVDELFYNSFGIYLPDDGQKAVTIRFRATELEAHYLRDLPLHQSQKEAKDGTFSIRVIPNTSLLLELCRRGDRIEILSPQDIRDKVADEHRKAAALYDETTKQKQKQQ